MIEGARVEEVRADAEGVTVRADVGAKGKRRWRFEPSIASSPTARIARRGRDWGSRCEGNGICSDS